MNKDFLELNLLDIKKAIAKECHFDLSNNYILNEKISFNPLFIKDNNLKVLEALKFISEHSLSLEGIKDIGYLTNKVKMDIVLNEKEILDVLLHFNNVKRIKNSFIKSDIDSLKDYVESLYFDDDLCLNIEKCLDFTGKIKLDATKLYFELNDRLNTHYKQGQELIKKLFVKYENSLQEKIIYIRDNRSCLLIKNRDKNSLKGMIHGESISKISTYFEPVELVGYNNKYIEVIDCIEQERIRILKHLTNLIKNKSYLIDYNLESLMKLDVVFAKASYGFKNNGIIANFNDEFNLIVESFKHPLIDEKKVVANSFKILNNKRKIVISGSNTGGKTIILKSIGLSVIMAYLAIPIPCIKANIPFYENILYAIDDLQSIEKSLSTFSANLYSLNNILKVANFKSLVLIDELGNGTDPDEGQSLALAIVKKLVEKNVSLVCTTHFRKIKDYALENEEMLLASVGFDQDNLKPTYKYLENDYGYSNSFKIARRYLEYEEIIDNAIEIFNQDKGESLKLIEELEFIKKQLIDDKHKIESKLNETENLKKMYTNKINDIKLKKEKIIGEFKKEYELKLTKFKKELADKLKNLNNDISEIEFDNFEKDQIYLNNNIEEFKIGEIVKLKLTSQNAKILALKNQNVELLINNKTMKTTIDNITKTPNKETVIKKYSHNFNIIKKPKELNVVGKNSEDALNEVSLYIDRLLLAKVKMGHIIHGVGQGILKKNIHIFLKNSPYIKEFKTSDFSNGGFGATDIFLK